MIRQNCFLLLLAVFVSPSAFAAWTVTETNRTNKVVYYSLANENWEFPAEHDIKATDKCLKVDFTSGIKFKGAAPCAIDFSVIDGGYKVVQFSANGRIVTPLRTSVTEFIAPDCSTLGGTEAFLNNDKLVRVSLSTAGSVTLINDGVFIGCANLAEFSPRTIMNAGGIGREMFSGCASLTGRFEFPQCKSFSNKGVFNGASAVEEIVAPNVTSVGQAVFSGCASLTNLVLSPSLEWFRQNSFAGTALSRDAVQRLLAPTLTTIGAWQSGSASWLGGCFSNSLNLEGELVWNLPNLTEKAVPSSCFETTNLEKILFRSPVDVFESNAFYDKRADKAAVEIYVHPDVPTKIKRNAFGKYFPPYNRLYPADNFDAWIAALDQDDAHLIIRKEDFNNTAWVPKVTNNVRNWKMMAEAMITDAQMCTNEGTEKDIVLKVHDSRVIAFLYLYGSSGGRCWILKTPNKATSLLVR
jgi:hypothetical protein